MKTTILTLTALSSLASAFPFSFSTRATLAPWSTLAPPPAGITFYQLQTKSATTAVSNQWISLASGSTSYALSATQSAATKFFLQKYDATSTYALHNADDTRQVALQGSSSSLLYMTDATNPSTDKIPKGTLMEWATFTTDSNVLGVKDGSTLTNRTFVAVKGTGAGYTVALYDGASTTTATISPLTINVVKST